MNALDVRSIKVDDFIGTMDNNGFGGFMAKVSINGTFLGSDFEEEFMMSKGLKRNESIAVQFSDSVGIELGKSEAALLKTVKDWIQVNLQNIHKAGLTKQGKWVKL